MATLTQSMPYRPRTAETTSGNLRDARFTAASNHNIDQIIFPKVYEDAWGSVDDSRYTDIERSRIFLLRIANMISDRGSGLTLRHVITSTRSTTVTALAHDIQHIIFQDKHDSFATTPLLQAVRFMLIKSRVVDGVYSDRAMDVMDFFFDPTLEVNIKPQPAGQISMYPYPVGRLRVAIIGGGPTALASAISLAEKGAGKVVVHMWERRWVELEQPDGSVVVGYPDTARRRDQVVTLQDSVTKLLSKRSFNALFAGRPERVWPGSANIQIRKVEDRFLKHVQEPEFHGLIHLHAEGVTQEDLEKTGDFHVLLGADGAASWVRKNYFEGYENERGKSWALGIAFNRPAGLPWSQPLNMFLTLGQTRYLLNASDHDGRGYLNMQLTDEEWHKMVSIDGQPIHFGRPGCLRRPDGSIPGGFEESQIFAPSEDRSSPLWISIEDGLKLFGFKESDVINVVRIPIVVQGVRAPVQRLPPSATSALRRPHALVALAGDANMTVHFWPGRGLNSGIKSGLALGDELVHALKNGRFIGMPLDALKEYNDFVMKLQDREHDKRSIPILNQSGTPETLGWLLSKASSVPDHVALEWLTGAMVQIADRLQGRPNWNYPVVTNVEPQIRIILRQMDSATLREMAVSFPWPTREMAGAEVLPIRTMKPAEKEKWLQGLWSKLSEEIKTSKSRSRSRNTPERDENVSTGRFEAPRAKSPRPVSPQSSGRLSPQPLGLSRSNATVSRRHGRSASLAVPGTIEHADLDDSDQRGRSGSINGEMSLGRMMTVSKRPPDHFLGEALSLALFRMKEAD